MNKELGLVDEELTKIAQKEQHWILGIRQTDCETLQFALDTIYGPEWLDLSVAPVGVERMVRKAVKLGGGEKG